MDRRKTRDAHAQRVRAILKRMQPHRAAAQVHHGVVTVMGVPGGEGEMVEVIVIRGSHDAERYAYAPVLPSEFVDAADPLGWDGEGWDEFDDEAR